MKIFHFPKVIYFTNIIGNYYLLNVYFYIKEQVTHMQSISKTKLIFFCHLFSNFSRD